MVKLSWVSQQDRPHGAFHMVVHLRQVLNPCSARCQEGEIAWLTSQEEGRWLSNCWKSIESLRAYNSMGVLEFRPTKYAMLSKNPLWRKASFLSLCPSWKASKRVFQVSSQISMPSVKVGNTKALNRRDVSFKDVTPTIASFLEVPVNTFVPAILHLLRNGSKYPCE